MGVKLQLSGFAVALAKERGCIPYDGALAVPLKRGHKHRGGRQRAVICDWTLISVEDRALAEFNWSIDPYGYVRRRNGARGKSSESGSSTKMQREIMGLGYGDKRVVDHINRDKTDNRRENLRICAQRENSQNLTPRKGASSKYRGVSWRKKDQKWFAYGREDGRMVSLGLYDDEEEAAEVARRHRAEHLPFAID